MLSGSPRYKVPADVPGDVCQALCVFMWRPKVNIGVSSSITPHIILTEVSIAAESPTHLSPLPSTGIADFYMGARNRSSALPACTFTRRAISSPSPRQVFNGCLWSIGQFLRQDLAMIPRSALNAYCSYLSFLSAKSAGVCRHAMPSLVSVACSYAHRAAAAKPPTSEPPVCGC